MQDSPYRLIPLVRRDGSIRDKAVVDAADYQALCQLKWFRNSNGYAARAAGNGIPSAVLMHRQILSLRPGDGLECDHINRDKLDNRRQNLRVVTHAENCRNVPSRAESSSAYRAVTWAKDKRRWRARVRGVHLGYFKDEDEAGAIAAAYLDARGWLH